MSYRDWRGVIDKALSEYDRPVVFHNASFDCHMFEMNGLPTPATHLTHDSAVMDCLVEPGQSHKLKVAAERLLGSGSEEQTELAAGMKTHGWTWATVPEDFEPYWRYAGQDTSLTARLAENLWPKVQPYLSAYHLEMAAQAVLYRIERRGMAVDRPYVAALLAEWEGELEGVGDEINGYGVENPNSRAQIGAVFKADGWEPGVFTKTGKPKLDAEILATMDHPLAALLTRHARLTKWAAAYARPLLDTSGIGGMVHPSFRVMGAKTGRMSSPQQQYPRGPIVRNGILPRSPEERLWSFDYDTMEMRMFAHFSQDPGLMKAAIDGFDMHRFGASVANDIAMEDVTSDQRQTAKHSVSFGKLYGAGDDKVAAKAGVSVAEIQRFNERYDAKFPGVVSFMADVTAWGYRRKRTEGVAYIDTWGGRRVTQDDGRMYALLNYIIQGSCADVFKRKLVDLDACGYSDYIVLCVHDENLMSLPVEMEDEVPKIVEIMQETEAFRVPLTVGAAGPLARWGDQEK